MTKKLSQSVPCRRSETGSWQSCGKSLEADYAVIPWLVRAVAIMRMTEQERLSGTSSAHLWVHFGCQCPQYSGTVINPLQHDFQVQLSVVTNLSKCNKRFVEDKLEFSAHAKSTPVQVWKSRSAGRCQVSQDATRSWRETKRSHTVQHAETAHGIDTAGRPAFETCTIFEAR